jgi:hypothetical protein
VKVIVGLASIMRMLRYEEKKDFDNRPGSVPAVEEITITVQGGYSESPGGDTRPPAWANELPSAYEFGVPHQVWQIKDRSASGCRLRAPVGDVGRVHPGALAAILDDETMRWSLVVVRRVKTRIGDRVDIGAEYVGQSPRGVTMAIAGGNPSSPGEPATDRNDRFTALYLRESTRQPVMPFKSLILAPVGPRGARSLTLRSTNAEYAVRLKEPIEEQDDFVWLPYEVLGRRPIVKLDVSADGATPLRPPASSPSFSPSQEGMTDWLAPLPDRVAGSSA